MYVNLIGRLHGLLWKNVQHLREGQSSVILYLGLVPNVTLLDAFKLLSGHLTQLYYFVICRYTWTIQELEEFQRASFLVAADVIYNDDLTDAFFSTLERIMSQSPDKVGSVRWIGY